MQIERVRVRLQCPMLGIKKRIWARDHVIIQEGQLCLRMHFVIFWINSWIASFGLHLIFWIASFGLTC